MVHFEWTIRIPNQKNGLVLPVEIDLELVMEVVMVDPPSDPFLEFYISGSGLIRFLRVHVIINYLLEALLVEIILNSKIFILDLFFELI